MPFENWWDFAREVESSPGRMDEHVLNPLQDWMRNEWIRIQREEPGGRIWLKPGPSPEVSARPLGDPWQEDPSLLMGIGHGLVGAGMGGALAAGDVAKKAWEAGKRTPFAKYGRFISVLGGGLIGWDTADAWANAAGRSATWWEKALGAGIGAAVSLIPGGAGAEGAAAMASIPMNWAVEASYRTPGGLGEQVERTIREAYPSERVLRDPEVLHGGFGVR